MIVGAETRITVTVPADGVEATIPAAGRVLFVEDGPSTEPGQAPTLLLGSLAGRMEGNGFPAYPSLRLVCREPFNEIRVRGTNESAGGTLVLVAGYNPCIVPYPPVQGGSEVPGDLPPYLTNLLRVWKFAEGTGQKVNDESGQADDPLSVVGGNWLQLGTTNGADAADPTWLANVGGTEGIAGGAECLAGDSFKFGRVQAYDGETVSHYTVFLAFNPKVIGVSSRYIFDVSNGGTILSNGRTGSTQLGLFRGAGWEDIAEATMGPQIIAWQSERDGTGNPPLRFWRGKTLLNTLAGTTQIGDTCTLSDVRTQTGAGSCPAEWYTIVIYEDDGGFGPGPNSHLTEAQVFEVMDWIVAWNLYHRNLTIPV